MKRYLFIVNDSPHGSQRAYNGLRLASAMARKAEVRVFLLGDGIINALNGLNPAHADYNPQDLLRHVAGTGALIAACGTCMEARGIAPGSLIPEVRRSSMDELVAWMEECDKVTSF